MFYTIITFAALRNSDATIFRLTKARNGNGHRKA